MKRLDIFTAIIFSVIFLPEFTSALPASGSRPEALQNVGFDQKLNEQAPLDLAFRDENGRSVKLGDYFGKMPVILTFMYYECPNLCPLALDELVRSLKPLSFRVGKEFNVLTISIDPGEGPALAMTKKRESVQGYARPGAEDGWHFLTGEEASIKQLTEAVGFRYAYDAEKDQYAHPSGIIVLTPQGKISRYFYGIEYSPGDIRLGLVDASAGKIGSPVDQLLLFCYQYDPATGKYTLTIMNALRLAGLATVLGLSAFVLVMVRRERAGKAKAEKEGLEDV
ncbi:MAG: SCO family protein [Deltaproteobacteria bacterium]|nr:SCO family protein [Deltaproteobacteria bacterium]